MEVWVDGQKNFRVEGEPADCLALFAAVTEFLRGQGRMPVEVKVDGVNVLPKDLRARFEDQPLSSLAKLEVRSEETVTMVADCLRQLNDALTELPNACRQLAEIFQSDAPGDGFEPFQHVAEIWQHIKAQEQLVANALDLDLAAAEVGGTTVEQLSEELNVFLQDAAVALQKNDAVALGDLLEYELAPRAEQESAIVAWLQARAAELPG